jgi:ferrous iron transport protein B
MVAAVRTPTVALVGNPNTGKTTLFNALAGMNQRVGNYPGVTVETKKGKLRHGDLHLDIIDLPGTYSLAPRSPDEMLAVDVILGHSAEPRPDIVVTIVDASNLERNLYLTTQVLELGVPVIIALNMIDVADAQGLKLDVDKLSQQFGVPVVPVQANTGRGLDRLKAAIAQVLERPRTVEGPAFPAVFEVEVAHLTVVTEAREPAFLIRRLLLDVGGHAEKRLTEKYRDGLLDEVKAARQRIVEAGMTLAGIEARIRYPWIRQRTAGCIERPVQRPVTWTDRIDRVLTHRIWGTVIFLALMFLVFESIFVLADYPMRLIGMGQEWLAGLVENAMDPGAFRSLLVEGVIGGVGAVVKFLPQIMILFAIIAFLEDCGYMARAAFLMDRLMARAGLNGKSFIPLLSSMACAVPGIMSARVIENPRDRLATILVAPLMSCSARLPVYSLLIGAFLPVREFGWFVPGLVFFGLYMIGIVLAPLMAMVFKRTMLRGEAPAFVMEMPLYKMPSLRTIGRRAGDAGWMFLKRAGTFILASMIVVWALLYFPSGNFEQAIAQEKSKVEDLQEKKEAKQPLNEEEKKALEDAEDEMNRLHMEWKKQSVLGRVGQVIEPAVKPLGWDWRVGMAALASFPAREVMVGTLGIIFGVGKGDMEDEDFRDALHGHLRESGVFSVPVALSVMVFFALCCQCVSTLVVIKRETNSWGWPIFTFMYMTVLAYVAALVTYQIGILF